MKALPKNGHVLAVIGMLHDKILPELGLVEKRG